MVIFIIQANPIHETTVYNNPPTPVFTSIANLINKIYFVDNKTINNKTFNGIFNNYLMDGNSKIITELLTKHGCGLLKNLKITENRALWGTAIKQKDIELLKQLKILQIEMALTNKELYEIMITNCAISSYELIEFLLGYILLNENITYSLVSEILFDALGNPITKTQIFISQLNIITILTAKENKKITNYLKQNFHYVIFTLNVPLVELLIQKYNIDINDIVCNYTTLQWIVSYFSIYPRTNVNLVYEMFDFLLSIGADIKQKGVPGLTKKSTSAYFDIFDSKKGLSSNNIVQNLRYIITKQETNNKNKQE